MGPAGPRATEHQYLFIYLLKVRARFICASNQPNGEHLRRCTQRTGADLHYQFSTTRRIEPSAAASKLASLWALTADTAGLALETSLPWWKSLVFGACWYMRSFPSSGHGLRPWAHDAILTLVLPVS